MRHADHFGASTKLVGITMALHANKNDKWRIYISEATLARECSLGVSTTRAAIKSLMEAGVIVRLSKGSASGRRAKASEYRLARSPSENTGDLAA